MERKQKLTNHPYEKIDCLDFGRRKHFKIGLTFWE